MLSLAYQLQSHSLGDKNRRFSKVSKDMTKGSISGTVHRILINGAGMQSMHPLPDWLQHKERGSICNPILLVTLLLIRLVQNLLS